MQDFEIIARHDSISIFEMSEPRELDISIAHLRESNTVKLQVYRRGDLIRSRIWPCTVVVPHKPRKVVVEGAFIIERVSNVLLNEDGIDLSELDKLVDAAFADIHGAI